MKPLDKDNVVVVDCETSSINPFATMLDRIGAWYGLHSEYEEVKWPFSNEAKRHRLDLALSNPHVLKVFHNATFDVQVLRQKGFVVMGEIHDTLLLAKAWRNDLPSYSLKALSYYLFGDPCLADANLQTWFNTHGFNLDERDMTKLPNGLAARYVKADVRMTKRLFFWLYPKVMKQSPELYDLELGTLKEVLEIEKERIYVNRKFYRNLIARNTRKCKTLAQELGINPRSTKQVGNLLEDSGLQFERTPTGLIATGKKALKSYTKQHVIKDGTLDTVLKVRELTGEISRHAKNILDVTSEDKPYFHAKFNQSLAVTRRFSSSGFFGEDGQIAKGNMQNFSRRTKAARSRFGIVPPEGYLVAAIDLSQIEPRILAFLIKQMLGDDTFVEKYRNDPHYNIYLDIAALSTGQPQKKGTLIYDKYKETVLARAYGSGPERTADQLDIPVIEAEALRKRVDYYAPQIVAIQRAMMSLARKQEFVQDVFGAVYYIFHKLSYMAVNYYCQGCAGSVFKWWLCELGRAIREGGSLDRVWNLLHDECDLYVKDDGNHEARLSVYCKTLLAPLEQLFGLPITAEYAVGRNWGECH